MEVRFNAKINGNGLYATKSYKKDEVIFVLTGIEYDKPKRETIRINNNIHIYDEFGIYMNHSFDPTAYINQYNVVALVDINIDDEITFNYNENEIDMAAPFYVNNVLVSGKHVTTSPKHKLK